MSSEADLFRGEEVWGQTTNYPHHCLLSLGQEDPLEREMATHSLQCFAWESPWTEKPGRLQSMGLQTVRLD